MAKLEYKIPRSFELMGQKIEVEKVIHIMQSDDATGLALLNMGKIQIQKSTSSFVITDERMYQTFLHELVHWILFKMKKEELTRDEKFVDTFADLLLQVMKTVK